MPRPPPEDPAEAAPLTPREAAEAAMATRPNASFWRLAAISYALAGAVVGGGLLWWAMSPPRGAENGGTTPAAPSAATLREAADAEWSPAFQPKSGDPIPAGSALHLLAGRVWIDLAAGHQLEIDAPARFEISSGQRIAPREGGFVVNVAASGETPFEAALPGALLRQAAGSLHFALAGSDPGHSRIQVLTGEAEIVPPAGAELRIIPAGPPHLLHANGTVGLDPAP